MSSSWTSLLLNLIPDILLWKLESDVFDVLFRYEEIKVGTNC